MIQKLRRKFILLSMASLLGVLLVLLSSINIYNYCDTVENADELLQLLAGNRGRFPERDGHGGPLPPHLSPEVPYESRYFTVTESQTGAYTVDVGRIAAIDRKDALRMLNKVTGRSGFVGDYRYLRSQTENGTQYIFLDMGRQLDTCHRFLGASIVVSLLGSGLVFLLLLLLSRRVVRPFHESYEKQRRFITDAGHELKTPLTIIRADADILEMELAGNEWLEDIQKQTERLAGLTADLVLLSRMEEGSKAFVMTDFSLSDRVSDTAQSFLAPAQTGGKTLSMAIAPMIGLCGDERAIEQLVCILLDNAVKYSPEGSDIRLTLQPQGGTSLLQVENRLQQPMEKAQLASLFDRFYRCDSARSSAGHGIGLSVAQAIVAAHGGKLRAELPEENTIRLTVTLPIIR